jgi:hypothetical protein
MKGIEMAANTKKVVSNIINIYDRRKVAIYALALRFSAMSINEFRDRQGAEEFWKNQSTQAMKRMFTNAFTGIDVVGFLMAHGVEYGPHLELANNGQNQAIRPIMNKYAALFIAAVKELY